MAGILVIDNFGYLEADLDGLPDVMRVGDDLDRALRELEAADLVFAFVHGTWQGLTRFRVAAKELRVPHLVYSGASPRLTPDHLRKSSSSLMSLVVELRARVGEINALQRAVLNALGDAWRSYVQGELLRASGSLSGIRLLAGQTSMEQLRLEFLAIVERCLDLVGPDSPKLLGCETQIENFYESLADMKYVLSSAKPPVDRDAVISHAKRLAETLGSLAAWLRSEALESGNREPL